jgi:hypothetical protein
MRFGNFCQTGEERDGYLEKTGRNFLLNNGFLKVDDSQGNWENPNHGFVVRSDQIAMAGYNRMHSNYLVIV